MTWKAYAAVSGAGILATYLAAPPREPAIPAGRSVTAAASEPAVNIVEEAARLQARLRAEAAFRAPSRNPFRFGGRDGGAPAVSRERLSIEPSAAVPPPEPEAPFIVLSGIGTDLVEGIPQRTAVLTTAGGVVLARAGDMVGAEYRVRAIDADAVDLESTRDGSIRTLRFPTQNP